MAIRDSSNDVAMTKHDLAEWMKRHDYDAEKLADWLGMTRQGVLNWLTGKRSIPEPICRLLNYFDIRPDKMGEF